MTSLSVSSLADSGQEVTKIPVPINYDIIRLFSEGLYRSPQKAIEELVCNGYDAGASRVHVLLPEEQPTVSGPNAPENSSVSPLWVIDNGHGLNEEGFAELWRVAESRKTDDNQPSGRPQIGQFGIGKLAAYVLARKLTHISRTNGKLLITSMDFGLAVKGQENNFKPIHLSLREVNEETARANMGEIRERDSDTWEMLFGENSKNRSWTAAALTDFKDLYSKLSTGALKWVLSSGLPLHSDFRISLNGEELSSSKETFEEITKIDINETLGEIGKVVGTARIFEKQLTTGKSEQFGRSNGFFIRVRGRVINLEDELFGVTQPNHAAWSRFAMEVDAEGLRNHLLSSREGVMDSEAIRSFRGFLLKQFNQCRTAYIDWERQQNEDIDISSLLSEGQSSFVLDPLLKSVSSTLKAGLESFYVGLPKGVEEERYPEWLDLYTEEATQEPFNGEEFVTEGSNAPPLRYNPAVRKISINLDHPYVDKLTKGDKDRNAARLFASSEVLLEGQLQEQFIDQVTIANVLRNRDRVLRLIAGDTPATANEVLRRLNAAFQNHLALERAVGATFALLGFDYERKGGNSPGSDGALYARLGRQKGDMLGYKLVYDSKQTNGPSVAAAKIDLASLERFRTQERADFGFFIAARYQAEQNDSGALNTEMKSKIGAHITLLKVEHLRKLVKIHLEKGITLKDLRELFENARTVPQVDNWIQSLQNRLASQGDVPIHTLLRGLEVERGRDQVATPNIIAVRARNPSLEHFEPERLVARLKAIESIVGSRWLEVEEDSKDVLMHQSANTILEELERNINGWPSLDSFIP